jgi:hypothetical protein
LRAGGAVPDLSGAAVIAAASLFMVSVIGEMAKGLKID